MGERHPILPALLGETKEELHDLLRVMCGYLISQQRNLRHEMHALVAEFAANGDVHEARKEHVVDLGEVRRDLQPDRWIDESIALLQALQRDPASCLAAVRMSLDAELARTESERYACWGDTVQQEFCNAHIALLRLILAVYASSDEE